MDTCLAPKPRADKPSPQPAKSSAPTGSAACGPVDATVTLAGTTCADAAAVPPSTWTSLWHATRAATWIPPMTEAPRWAHENWLGIDYWDGEYCEGISRQPYPDDLQPFDSDVAWGIIDHIRACAALLPPVDHEAERLVDLFISTRQAGETRRPIIRRTP